MDDLNTIIYGLELQARAIAPQYGESEEIRYLIGTHSLKTSNQVHLLEYNEEKESTNAKIFEHTFGEIWKITSSPQDKRLLATCFTSPQMTKFEIHAVLLRMPENLEERQINAEYLSWQSTELLDTQQFGERTKAVEFHPSVSSCLACVVDSKIVIFDRAESKTRVVSDISATSQNSKSISPFTGGKWSPHHQGHLFVALHENTIKAFDTRDSRLPAWKVEDANAQTLRDIDCNPNKPCHYVTGSDDGYMKIWDSRKPKKALFERNDHAHWIWCVRYNVFHDQLLLSSSSDCKVNLTCAGSVSSETPPKLNDSNDKTNMDLNWDSLKDNRKELSDGLLHTFDQHEDSVYSVEWSNVDPWIFASLSYDGRVLISKVPKQFKYEIIF